MIVNTPGRFSAQLQLEDYLISALIDTGAVTSLIRQDTWEKLNTKGPLSKCNILYTLNNSPLKILGQTEVKFVDARPIPVVVVPNMDHQFLLGSDALHLKACLDYERKKFRWFDNSRRLLSRMSKTTIASVEESTGHEEIDDVFRTYAEVFDTDKQGGISKHVKVKCTIPTEGHPPIKQRAYRLPLSKRHVVKEQMQEMMEAGVIRPSTSPWASPISLVPKKDGTTRFCIDYRKLNSVTRKNSYPLPLISDIFDQLGEAKVFTTLDLKSGYWQIPVSEEDIEKTAFITDFGLS